MTVITSGTIPDAERVISMMGCSTVENMRMSNKNDKKKISRRSYCPKASTKTRSLQIDRFVI